MRTSATVKSFRSRSLKDIFEEAYPGTSGIGQSLTITDDLVIRGKVISSDQAGNVYKSMYLYDESCQSAIEIKVTSGYYITYAPGRLVYIRLQGLVLGNYRTMLSVGVASTNSDYANGNMEDRNTLEEHVVRRIDRLDGGRYFGGYSRFLFDADG